MAFQTHPRLILAPLCAGLIGAGLFAPPAARAAVYAVVRSEPDVVTVMDPAAVEAVAGSDTRRRAWSVSVQRNLVSGGPPQPGYVRTLNEYDCAAHQIRWQSFDVYSRFGALVLHKDNADRAWTPAAPRSEAESSLRLVCDHSNRWSAIASPSLSQLVITLMKAWDEAAPPPPRPPVSPPRPHPKAPAKRAPAARRAHA